MVQGWLDIYQFKFTIASLFDPNEKIQLCYGRLPKRHAESVVETNYSWYSLSLKSEIEHYCSLHFMRDLRRPIACDPVNVKGGVFRFTCDSRCVVSWAYFKK